MRFVVLTALSFSLAACGGSRAVPPGIGFAQGPISEACERSGRAGASRELCGCIQFVADATLSGSDQRRGATFFGNPERAQEVRLNDSPSADAFWARWTDFAEAADNSCQSLA